MKAIFGAVYRKVHDTNNEQHYHRYIPVAIKDNDGTIKYRMVDTYMISRPSFKTTLATEYDRKIWYLEQANCGEKSWGIFHASSNYYYKNHYDISSLELDEYEWELIADLRDYKIVSGDEAEEYLREDTLTYIPLWNEDHYRWSNGRVGRCFVKKDAQKDGWRIYNKALNDYPFGFESDYRLDKVEQTCKNVLANMKLGYGKKVIIKRTLKKIKKYQQLSNEYKKFCKSLESKRRNR